MDPLRAEASPKPHLPSQAAPQPTASPLLLRRLRILRLTLRPLLPHPHQPCIAPRLPERHIRILSPLPHLTPLNLPNRLLLPDILHRQHLPQVLDDLTVLLLRGLDLFFRRVQRLVLARFPREEDQARAVGLEALHVGGEAFGGEVGAAGVDGDADCGGQFAGDAGFLL